MRQSSVNPAIPLTISETVYRYDGYSGHQKSLKCKSSMQNKYTAFFFSFTKTAHLIGSTNCTGKKEELGRDPQIINYYSI